MDFSYSEEQQSIIDLASQILRDGTPQERLREIEKADGPRFDKDLWAQLGEAGLLGVTIPEEQGGAGLGFLEAAAIVEQVGRTAAPIPFIETAVLGALPLAQYGTDAQCAEFLPKVAAGRCILTAALVGYKARLVDRYLEPTTRDAGQLRQEQEAELLRELGYIR